MATRKKEDDNQPIELVRIDKRVVEIPIRGLTPYIPNTWGEKVKDLPGYNPGWEKGEQAQEAAPKPSRRGQLHQPHKEAEACLYRLPDGRLGAPSTAFKAAMIGACREWDGITMVRMKTAIFVVGEGPEQLVPITGDLLLWEYPARNSDGSVSLRYRYKVLDWKAVVTIRYRTTALTRSSVISLLHAAGDGGIGDWRPSAPKSNTGTFGTWEVDLDAVEVIGDEPAAR